MRKFDKNKNMEKANQLAEQRYLESKGIINEGLGEFTPQMGHLLDMVKHNPQQYPIDSFTKETNIGYEILNLPPFNILKGYVIKPISQMVWGLYDKNVRDQVLAQLKVEDGMIIDYKIKS